MSCWRAGVRSVFYIPGVRFLNVLVVVSGLTAEQQPCGNVTGTGYFRH